MHKEKWQVSKQIVFLKLQFNLKFCVQVEQITIKKLCDFYA